MMEQHNPDDPQTPAIVSNQRPRSLDDFQIAIICALKKEYDAVDALMEELWERQEAFRPRRPDNNTYTFGRLGGKPVVLVNLPSMGEISAAVVASHVKISLPKIEVAFLVGLCAGAPHDDKGKTIQMADVIIGTQVIQEDYGRQLDTGFERKTEVEDVLGRLPSRVRAWLANRSSRRPLKQLKKDTEDVLLKAFQDPETATDFAFPGQTANESFPSSRQLQIFFGRIGSSNPTLRNQALRDGMIRNDNILGFEMESAGVWDQLPTVVVKGVCDYGDSQKTKEWQDFAALTAAACTKALIRDYVLHAEEEFLVGPPTPESSSKLELASKLGTKRLVVSDTHFPRSSAIEQQEPSGKTAAEAREITDTIWFFVSSAWIYAFLKQFWPNCSSVPDITDCMPDGPDSNDVRSQIEDAIAGVRKVVAIFDYAAEAFDDAKNTCSKLRVELWIAAEWLTDNMSVLEKSPELSSLQDVQIVLDAIEKVVQDRPDHSRHKYPNLRCLALSGYESRLYKSERARISSRLRELLKPGETSLEELERTITSFTKSEGSAQSSVEASNQHMSVKPAGYSLAVKKAIHRILSQSMQCKCTGSSLQGSAHLLQILLEPAAAATPGIPLHFELLISSKPIADPRPLRPSQQSLPGHWKDVFITYSSAKPGPAVRWADRSENTKVQPEFTEEIKQDDRALCGIIPQSHMQRWGVQITGDQLFRTGKPLPLHKRVQPYHGVPLGSILSLLTDRIRACLAYTLAQSLWQFYDCDLTGIRWTSDSIELMWYSGGSKAEDPKLFSTTPYLAYRSTSHDSYVQECLHRGTECDAIHAYPRVVALGILLLEIGMGKKLELPKCAIGDIAAGPTKDEVWDYAQEQAKREWPNLNFPNYWRSVRNCFDLSLFNMASSDPEANVREKERELSKRRDILYEEVVLPLEQLIHGTGWVDGLGSNEHVSFPPCLAESALDHVASSASVAVAA